MPQGSDVEEAPGGEGRQEVTTTQDSAQSPGGAESVSAAPWRLCFLFKALQRGDTVDATRGRVERLRKRIAKQVSQVGLMKWLASQEPLPFCAPRSTRYPSRYHSCF